MLTVQQSYALLATHRVFAREICDKCGRLLGAVRFTRKDESGVWCSRECRGDGERRAIRKGGRPRKYKDERMRKNAHALQQRDFRLRSSVTETPSNLFGNTRLTGAKTAPSTIPLTPLSPGLETGGSEK